MLLKINSYLCNSKIQVIVDDVHVDRFRCEDIDALVVQRIE